MKPLRSVRMSVLSGVVGLVFAGSARAEPLPCPSLAVEADENVLALDPEFPEHVRRALVARDRADPCARVRLSANHQSINVAVALVDGRSTSRAVPRLDDVIPTLEALLIIPRDPAAAPVSDGRASSMPSHTAPERARPLTPASMTPAVRTVAHSSAAHTERATPGEQRADNHLGVELSVFTIARIGDEQNSVGVGALSFVDCWSWLVGFMGRADRYSALGDGEPQMAIELAVLGGKRFSFQNTTLDLITGPGVAVRGGSATRSTPVGAAPAAATAPAEPERATSDIAPRLLLASHLNFAARSVVRGFVGVEGELRLTASTDRGSNNMIDAQRSPELPSWMLGIALGAVVGTR